MDKKREVKTHYSCKVVAFAVGIENNTIIIIVGIGRSGARVQFIAMFK